MSDDKIRAIWEALASGDVGDHEWRAANVAVLRSMSEQITTIGDDLAEIKARTPTKDELASVRRALDEDQFWAQVGQRIARYAKTIIGGAAVLIGIWGAYEVIAKIKALFAGAGGGK